MECCWVRSCKNYATFNKNIDLYPLPPNLEERALWAMAFGLSQYEVNCAGTRICGAHFRRKYFLDNKNEVTHHVNGSGPVLFLHNPGTSMQPDPFLNTTRLVNSTNSTSSSNVPVYMAVNNQEPNTYFLHIPDANSVRYAPPASSQTAPCIIKPVAANIQNIQPPQNVHTVSNEVAQLDSVLNEQTIQKRSPQTLRSIAIDSCELYCQEEHLTPEQEKFQYEEWLNYVKYTSNVQNLPYISTSNGSEIGEKISGGVSPELPVLIYSNAVQQPQTTVQQTIQQLQTSVQQPQAAVQQTLQQPQAAVHQTLQQPQTGVQQPQTTVLQQTLQQPQIAVQQTVQQPQTAVQLTLQQPQTPVQHTLPQSQTVLVPSPPNSISNTPLLYQIPPSISSPLNLSSPVPSPASPVINIASPVVTQSNVPLVLPVQPSVFPVKLEQNLEQSTEELPIPQCNEEILPLILQDAAIESLFSQVKQASSSSLSVYPKCKLDEPMIIGSEGVPSPSLSVSSGNDRCMSPDLLCNVEVNFEENDSESLPASMTESTPTFLGSNLDTDNSNGPKIVDVICGDAVAHEFYKGIDPVNVEFQHKQDDSSTKSETLPSENSMPKIVTQWSIFSMQKTIAVISSGTVDATIRNLLGVRLHIPPITSERDIPTKLKNRLREENFLTVTPWWLVRKRFLPLNPPCISCGSKVFCLTSCYEFLDNLCWVCDNKKCKKIYPAKRPKFFERFPSFTLEELLLLTYHWACKSRIWIVNYDVPVHAERIWEFFCALQDLCGDSVSRNCFIGKNTKHTVTVEVSAVKLGKFFILCAYDRRNKVSRLKAITTEEACGSVKHIQVLEEWLGNNCTLITWKQISDEFLPNVTKVSADPGIGHVQSPGRHILNASKYLGKTMVQLFQNICHEQLTLETVQRTLDEVQWRERHGKTEESAFWGILNEITRLNDPFVYTDTVLGDISKDRYYHKADVSFRLRWGPYDIGNKTSATHTVADKSSELQQAIAKGLHSTNKVANSTVQPSSSSSKLFANRIESLKKHPISVSLVVTPKNLKDKTAVSDFPISPRELLSIRIVFNADPLFLNNYKVQANKLAQQLKEEGYLINPIRWLYKKNYIKSESSCYVCHGPAKLHDNPKFSDGVSWLCQKTNCKFENTYSRPPFFCFGFKLEVVFAIIYHWAVQSDYTIVTKSVPVNETNIIGVHRKLQKVCAEFAKSSVFKIGGRKSLVEVAFVRFANCFILGAMERNSKHSRFRTFSSETKLHIDSIRNTLISWLWEDSTVVVNSNKYLGRYCMEERIHLVFADQTITDVNSKKYHTLTITSYLQNHIKTMFRSIKVDVMSADILQVYLDELVWRERYGRTPVTAFNSIMNCIFGVEYGDLSFGGFIDDATLLKQAASFYGFSLPLPQLKVVVEKLPDHVIHNYTTRRDEVKIVDDFELTKDIKEEIISDDEVEILQFVPNPENASSSSSSSTSTASSATSIASSSLANENHIPENQIPENQIPENRIPENLIPENHIPTIELTNESSSEVFNFNKNNIEVKRYNEDFTYKRYSDKCYSHRRKTFDLSNGKSRCVECKDIVSEDHYAKQYSCSDCKSYVYSTYCQRAFARHRAYILFGRKICTDSNYNKSINLSQKWFCSCGYGSREGNKLASHLIECRKSTCYLKSNESIIIL